MKDDKRDFWNAFKECCTSKIDISKGLKDLFEKMVCVDVKKRITIEQIKEHPWFMKEVYTKDELKIVMADKIKPVITSK